ncbi:MAG: chromosome segregation protein SMC [Oscillatoriales cyanobacterium]|nr:MAG: chromosome segregation protein SMC [Oscillatoriales cyanobacterium]
MEGKRFIRSLQLQNFLSYGSQGETIELRPLNVLIGTNASGKSNLIEAIALLKATPTDLPAPIRQGGGISDFLWKGEKGIPTAKIETILDYPERAMPLRYQISFTTSGQRVEVVDEAIEDMEPRNSSESEPFFYYRYSDRGRPVINVTEDNEPQTRKLRTLRREDIIPDQSILSQRKDPEQYPELSYLGNTFADIGLYRNWQTGRDSVSRKAQQTDLPEHPLLEDGGNLGLVLNNLQYQLGSRQIIEKLKLFYDAAEELSIKIYGGTVQIFIRETGLIQPIPATREEPEIGLHPDILPAIAEMLIEASQRTQLIVTTHSDALVSALSPESVLICDRDNRGSHLSRLDPERLKKWLENYSLGDLWRMGEIGGNRW